MTNLASILTATARRHPARIALRLGDQCLTYAQLDEQASRVAGRLQEQGIGPGAHIAIMLPNVIAFPVLYYGILRTGAAVVPMNPQLKNREVAYYLGDSEVRILFVWHTAAEEATAAANDLGAEVVVVTEETLGSIESWPLGAEVSVEGSDTAVILYTSGTTGAPKGAQLTHDNMRRNAEIMAGGTDLFAMTSDDVVMGCLPLFHVFGQTCALNTVISTGASLVLIPRFDPVPVLETIARERVTIFAGVPTMYVALLNAQREGIETSSLRLCVSGGASLPVEVLNGVSAAFGAPVLEGYGLSETSPVASFNRTDASKPGSIGQPIDGVEMKIVGEDGSDQPDEAVGEIAIRGHNIMRGYWKLPDATVEAIRDGWFHTGDLGKRDAEGFYFIIDRKKDVVNRGGYSVYPREIEEVLYEHPAVIEVAVVGVPHASLGEEVGAAVTLRPGASTTPEELRDYVRDRVAAYKYPRLVWLVDALPKGPTGKLLKREITVPAHLT